MPLVPISENYNVTVTVSAGGVQGASFGSLLILGQSAIATSTPTVYASLADWITAGGTTTDEEYLALSAALSQTPRVSSIKIADVGTMVNGVQRLTFASDFQSGGTVGITWTYADAAGNTITEDISVAYASSHADTATAVAAAIQAEAGIVSCVAATTAPGATFTITVDQTLARTGIITFTVKAVTGTGAETASESTITPPTTLTEALNTIAGLSTDFYAVTLAKWQSSNQQRKMDGYRLAAWLAPQTESHVGIVATEDSGLLAGTAGNLAKIAEAGSYDRFEVLYHHDDDEYLDVAVASRWLGVDPDSQSYPQHGMLLTGVTASNLSAAQRAILKADNCGYYAQIARVGNQVQFPKMGSGRFPDVQLTVDWTKARVEEEIAALFQRMSRSNRKLSYTNVSAQAIAGCLERVYSRGVAAQHYAADRTDPVTGDTVSGITVTIGDVASESSSNREARIYTGISATFWLAGAMQTVTASVILEV